jgi:hypothetical protein
MGREHPLPLLPFPKHSDRWLRSWRRGQSTMTTNGRGNSNDALGPLARNSLMPSFHYCPPSTIFWTALARTLPKKHGREVPSPKQHLRRNLSFAITDANRRLGTPTMSATGMLQQQLGSLRFGPVDCYPATLAIRRYRCKIAAPKCHTVPDDSSPILPRRKRPSLNSWPLCRSLCPVVFWHSSGGKRRRGLRWNTIPLKLMQNGYARPTGEQSHHNGCCNPLYRSGVSTSFADYRPLCIWTNT